MMTRMKAHLRARPMGRALFLGMVLLAAAPPVAGQDVPSGTMVMVSALDRLDGQPVRGAVLTLTPVDDEDVPLEAGRVYGSDETGRLRSAPVPPGRYLLDVRAPAYRGYAEVIVVGGPSPLALVVRLERDVMALEGVAAVAERNPFLEEGGFYERRGQGFGVTYTREELALMGVFQTSDVFRTLSGVTLDYAGSPVSPFVRFRQGCRPDVVLDGTNLGPNVRIDDLVNPSDVQGLEVYRGAGGPGTLSNNSCGSVIIWTLTRQPEGAKPFAWNRVIFGLVVLAIAEILRP